jgi:phosphatidylglycerol:prolipoprotein diacylglycerol transferase
LLNLTLLAGFGGGKLLYLLQYARGTADFTASALAASAGFSVFGGFIGSSLFLWGFARWKKLTFFALTDAVYTGAALAHGFGRIGCFLAGCCYGKPTGLPWGYAFTNERSMVPTELLGVRLHPVQLYEAAADAAFAAVMWRLLLATDAGRLRPGTTTAAYFVAYGLVRFALERLRADTVPFAFGLTGGQGLGLALAAAGGGLYWRASCARSS